MNRSRALILAAGAVAAAVLASVTVAAYSDANDWAAIVDGHQIDEGDFLDELAALRENPDTARQIAEQVGQTAVGTVPAALSAAWLSGMVEGVIIKQIASGRSITAGTDDRRQVEASTAAVFGGEEVWQSLPARFRSRYVDRQSLYLAVQREVAGTATEEDIRAAYEAVKDQLPVQSCASHILVETIDEAQALKAELDAGADFAETARQRSIDTASKDAGGDVGCFTEPASLEGLDPLGQALFLQPLDTVSDPIQSESGFHLVKVSQRGAQAYEEIRPQLAQQAQQQVDARFREFLIERIQKADIKINPKYGKFEIGFDGPRVVPPEAPAPPDRLPVDGEPPAGLPPGFVPTGP